MILKTRAICIKNTRYGESSVISKMFSEEHGLSSYMIQGIHRKSATIKPSHLAPGNLVELVVYQKPQASIQRIKELRIEQPLFTLQTDMVKNAVLQFMLEIVVKTTEEHHPDPQVYLFLKQSVLALENNPESIAWMPLHFLCDYLKFSGWFPNLELWEEGKRFHIREGRFDFEDAILPGECIAAGLSRELYLLFRNTLGESLIDHRSPQRRELFAVLLQYYEIHLLKGRKIKSPAILAEVLS